MAYIDNWFHFYDTTESFEVHRKQGLIGPDSICFLRETGQVYTQGNFFGICRERYEELEQLVLTHDAQIKNILGTKGPSVDDGAINNIADLVNFLDGFTDQDNLKDFLNAMKTALEAQIETVRGVLSDRLDTLEDEVHNDSESLRGVINNLVTSVEGINTRLSTHDTTLSTINTTIESHIRNYNNLRENYNNFKAFTETKFNTIDSNTTSINQSITTLQNYFSELEQKFDGVENEIARVESILQEARDLIENFEERFGSVLASIEAFKREVDNKFTELRGEIGAPNGIAPLDTNAKVPSEFLPSYVDDVLEYAAISAFPPVGESGKIYVALDTNLQYRWSGSQYTELSKSLGLGETASTAYPGNKGKKNADDIAAHKADTNNPHNVTKAQLGLDKVNNTSDADKPVSTAQAAAIKVVQDDLIGHKNNKANPHEVTKAQVGLSNVDNTSDLDKPVSSATQAVLDTVNVKIDSHKSDKSNPHEVTKEQVGLGNVDNTSDMDKPISTAAQTAINSANTSIEEHKKDKSNPHNVTKEQVGLGSVDNTADSDKPISDATQAALNVLDTSLSGHIADKTNPHDVTKEQVGLGSVDNTSDADKPVSKAAQDLFNTKVDKITGKGLSTNDFTNEAKTKLDSAMTQRRLSTADIDDLTEMSVGDLVYDTTKNKFVYWNGINWVEGTDENTLSSTLSDYVTRSKLTNEVEALDAAIDTKVDKVAGKSLSTNDFTDEAKTRLDNSMPNRRLTSEEISSLASKIAGDLVYNTTSNKYMYWNGTSWEEVGYVDLSDYVTSDTLNTEVEALDALIDTKVTKIEGKGLSANDFTDDYKGILDNPWGETIE